LPSPPPPPPKPKASFPDCLCSRALRLRVILQPGLLDVKECRCMPTQLRPSPQERPQRAGCRQLFALLQASQQPEPHARTFNSTASQEAGASICECSAPSKLAVQVRVQGGSEVNWWLDSIGLIAFNDLPHQHEVAPAVSVLVLQPRGAHGALRHTVTLLHSVDMRELRLKQQGREFRLGCCALFSAG